MTARRLSLAVFLMLLTLCMVQAIWYYPQLPEKVASHFDLSGQPDAWSTKASFVTFYLVMTSICTLVFLAISFGMAKIPISLINLPNKEYWLSPERREHTLSFICQYFLWFGSATLLLLFDMFHQSVQVHLGKADSLTHPMLSTGLFIGFTAAWSIGLLVKFRKKPRQDD